jgi:cytochrome c556
VLKKGLKIDGAWFIAPELAVNLIGRDVQVRLDPVDLGRVYVFHEGDFVCVAECPERTGMNRQAVAQQAKRMQVEEVNRQKRELKALARKVDTTQVVDAILRQNAADAGKLVAMPKASTPFETQGTRAAAAATHAVDRGMNSTIPPDLQRHMGQASPLSGPGDQHLKADEEKFANGWNWMRWPTWPGAPADRVKFYAGWPKTAAGKFSGRCHQHRNESRRSRPPGGKH